MLIVISPAKTLDFESPRDSTRFTIPDFLEDSRLLIEQLRTFDPPRLAQLMDLSDALAALNVARYASWHLPFTPENARQAVFAFNGDVYEGLDARTLDAAAVDWAQDHLRILSGLYGLLRPLDLMQPYRLEMGTRLPNARGKDLYAFWGSRLAASLAELIRSQSVPALVNLASEEYFKAVPRKALGLEVIQPVFQERKGTQWKVVSFHAKRARGLMTRYAIEHRLEDPEGLKAFDVEGYAFAPDASDASNWVFRRAG
ncbi:MAG: peroxide stress protein YaaA [Pseudomonadota bacterium]|jgi:cytoplasmic iron level regulating protein YaaA (DUF328/UPF0246 family)